MTRVAITNTVALNGGDAAIALAIVDAIRSAAPQAEIEVHDSRPDVAARYYPSLRWRRQIATLPQATRRPRRGGRTLRRLNEARLVAAARLWRRAATRPLGAALLRTNERAMLARFAEIDLVVSTGGTYLVGQYALWPRIFEYRLAAALGTPVVFYTQSLGPFSRRSERKRLRSVFTRSPLVLLRDERSRGHLLDLGVPPDALHVVADSVFGRPSAREIAPNHRAAPGGSVAVSVRKWPPGAPESDTALLAYRRAIAAAVTWLVRDRSARVTFISTCQGIPEYWTDDASEAKAVAALLPEDVRARVAVDDGFHTPGELADAFAGFDVVVATRMHAAILALTAGTPVFPIAYEFKTTELFTRMGLGEHVVEFDGISETALVERLRAFLGDLPRLAATLGDGVREQRAEAERAARLLSRVVDRRG